MGFIVSIVEKFEQEAKAIIVDARKRANEIIRRAEEEAKRILEDKSYLQELRREKEDLQRKLEEEVKRIIDKGQREAEELKRRALAKLDIVARSLVKEVAGI